MSFEQDANGAVLETPLVTTNPDGSTTIDDATIHSDGSLANETISTTSADGLTKTIAFDDAGNGIIDRRQTDTTVVGADGSKTETVATTSANGTALSRVTTHLSADRQTETIATDATGDGATTRSETIKTGTDGATTDSVSNLNPDGSLANGSVTTVSADGLSKTMKVDASGDGTFNRTTTDTTTIGAAGIRTDTVTDLAANTVSATGVALPGRGRVRAARRHLRPCGPLARTPGIEYKRAEQRSTLPGTLQDQLSMRKVRKEESLRGQRCNGW